MRNGITAREIEAVSAPKIITAYALRLDFASETIFAWTGVGAAEPNGSGDTDLDGNRFEPLAAGVTHDVGSNTMTYSGSDELTISIAVPATPHATIAAAQVLPAEYQSRPVIVWRGLLWPQADPLAPPIWLFRRIRTGAMTKLEVTNDGTMHNLTLTIESHQALVSNATNQTYLDQKRYDPADTSQDYAASIANGDPAPSKPVVSYGGGGYGRSTIDGFNVATHADY